MSDRMVFCTEYSASAVSLRVITVIREKARYLQLYILGGRSRCL